MSEEIINNEQQQEQAEPTNEQYIEALKQMSQNTVTKEEYRKLQEENKKLLNTLVAGGTIEKEPEKASSEEIEGLREKLFDQYGNLTNLEYVENALKLREALISNGERDPFLPGKSIAISDADVATANHVAEVFKECVEYAAGDSEAFTSELMRRTNDIRIRR